MASAAKPDQHGGIDLQLKAWIDSCLVPLLVKEYLAEFEPKKNGFEKVEPVAVSIANDGLSAERATS